MLDFLRSTYYSISFIHVDVSNTYQLEAYRMNQAMTTCMHVVLQGQLLPMINSRSFFCRWRHTLIAAVHIYIPVTVCLHKQTSMTRNEMLCVSVCTGLHLQMYYEGV